MDSLQRKEYNRQWKLANKEKAREHRNRWAKNNPDKEKARNKAWREQHKGYLSEYREEHKNRVSLATKRSYYRTGNLKRRGVGIDKDKIDEIRSVQKCQICGKVDKNRALCIDHDHASGKLRGALCMKCNMGIGCFLDDIQLLEKAIAYLKLTK